MLKIPYGISSFEQLRTGNYLLSIKPGNAVRKEAVAQIEKYAKSAKVMKRLGKGYKKVALTFAGKNQIYMDEVK